MLKLMRDSFQQLKWILIALVAVFVLFVFVDWGAGGLGGGPTNPTQSFAARVNGETITINEYARAYKNYEDMYRQMYGGQAFTAEMAQSMGLPKQVLDSLIDQRLLSQEGARLNLGATPEEVRRKLLEMPTFTQDGKFVGMELYTRYVTGPLGYPSAAAFEEALARDITLQKIQSAFDNSIVISPKAAEAEYRRMNEAAKIRYIFYPAARDLATVTVSDAEVQAYFTANKSKYQHGEQRQIRYLLADAGRLRAQMNPSDAELRKRYDANKEAEYKSKEAAHVHHILVKVEPGSPPNIDAGAKAKADGIVAQLRGGGDFAALARANSQDPSSAGNGGDMGWVEMGQTVEPFERAIFSSAINSVEVVKSPEYGYHIIKVVARRPAGYRPFEEVKPELQARVSEEMAQDQARSEITRIASILRQKKPANVQEFVAQANERVSSNDSGWFGKNDPIPGLGPNQPLSQWIFSAKQGDVGEVTGTQRGMVIPYVAGTRPAGTPELKEIRARVEEDAKQAKAKDAAARTLQTAMAGATTIDAVGAKIGLAPTEASVNRQQGQVAGINGSATELIDAAINGRLGAVSGPLKVNDGVVVFQVTEQKKVTPQELQQNRVTYIDTLRQQQARSLRAVLIERLRKNARVEVNDELIRPTTTPAGV